MSIRVRELRDWLTAGVYSFDAAVRLNEKRLCLRRPCGTRLCIEQDHDDELPRIESATAVDGVAARRETGALFNLGA